MAKRLKIGELASRTGLSRATIRSYEREAVLPRPARTPAGYRLYGPEVVERLALIKRARALGFSLADIRDLLGGSQDPEACRGMQQLLAQKLVELDHKIRDIQALHEVLSRALLTCRATLRDGRVTAPCPNVLAMLQSPVRETPLWW